jgi:hypothetical protein
MQIMAVMGKNQIRCNTGLQLLKECLNFSPSIWETTFPERLRNYGAGFCSTKKPIRAGHGLSLSGSFRAEHNPGDMTVRMGSQKPKYCPATPDLDIIRMCAETQN